MHPRQQLVSIVSELVCLSNMPPSTVLRDWRGDILIGCPREILGILKSKFKPYLLHQVNRSNRIRLRLSISTKPMAARFVGKPIEFSRSSFRSLNGTSTKLGEWLIVKNNSSGTIIAKRQNQIVVAPTRISTIEALLPDILSAVRLNLRSIDEFDGAVLIHGAVVAKNKQGVLILGDKGAGKSVLMASLLSMGFEYVAGDRVMVMQQNGSLISTGFIDTVRLPYIALNILGLNDDMGEAGFGNKRVLYPCELSDLKGVKLNQKTKLTCAVRLSWSDTVPAVSKLYPTTDLCEEEVFTPVDPTYNDWLDVLGRAPTRIALHAVSSLPLMSLTGSYTPSEGVELITKILGQES